MECTHVESVGMPLRDICAILADDGVPTSAVQKLLETYGLDAENDDPCRILSADNCWRLFTEHAAMVDDELHNVFVDRLRAGGTNLVVARMVLCDTIHEALCAYSDAWKIVSSDIRISVARRSSGLSLRWSVLGERTELQDILLECTAATFYGIFCWMADDTIKVHRVHSPASRSDSQSTLLETMGAPVVYKGTDVEIVFAPAVADLPIVNSSIEAWRDGVHATIINLVKQRKETQLGGVFAEQVKAMLLDGMDQAEIATACKMSPKTLARRLGLEGCSFRDLANEVKCQRATSLIHAGLTVESISEQLGYEDTRSFRRAFRRWMGSSPSEYRANLTP